MKPAAIFKSSPEDFVVEELPLYEPSGEGEHVYIRFQKRNLTTMDAVRVFATALDIRARDIGVAGLKDKVGITTQTISVQRPLADTSFVDRVRELTLSGITILDAKRHGNKLRTGHLKANRFTVTLRGLRSTDVELAEAGFARIGRDGAPNRYGDQRFGTRGDNADRARGWLAGKEPRPRDAKIRRFLCSALQSAVFNAVLDARVADGTWNHAQAGDVLSVDASGGIFLCEDPAVDDLRVAAFEVTPTGPLPGPKMKSPALGVAELEERLKAEIFGNEIDLAELASNAEGTRRPLRLRVKDASFSNTYNEATDVDRPIDRPKAVTATVRFELGSGAYATTVLGEVFDLRDTSRPETGGSAKDESDD